MTNFPLPRFASGCALTVALGWSIFGGTPAHAAVNTPDTVQPGATDLTSAASYSAGLPTNVNDVIIDANTTAAPATLTLNSSLAFGSLNDLNANAIVVSNDGTAGAANLTLGGSAAGTNSLGTSTTSTPATTDLLYVAAGSNLTVNRTGANGQTLGIILGQTGSFDAQGPITLNAPLNGNAKTLTVSGAGLVTFAGGFSNFATNAAFNTGTNVSITATSALAGATFMNGNTTISAGTTTAATTAVTLVINNTGVLTVTGTGSLVNPTLRIGSVSGQSANLTVGSGGQVVAGNQIEFSHAVGTVASNLNLNGGSFTTGVGFTMTGPGVVNFNGGTLFETATLTTLRVGAGAGTLTLSVQGGGALIDVVAGKTVSTNSVFSHGGTAATDGGLTKLDTGTLSLGGANTYTGGTTVNAGILTATANSALGTGNVSVLNGATLTLATGVTDAIADSATLTLGSTGIVALNGTNGSAQESVGALFINGVMQTPGTYGATGSGATNILPANFTGTGELLVLVPEPSTWTMLFAGLGGLFALVFGRKRAV